MKRQRCWTSLQVRLFFSFFSLSLLLFTVLILTFLSLFFFSLTSSMLLSFLFFFFYSVTLNFPPFDWTTLLNVHSCTRQRLEPIALVSSVPSFFFFLVVFFFLIIRLWRVAAFFFFGCSKKKKRKQSVFGWFDLRCSLQWAENEGEKKQTKKKKKKEEKRGRKRGWEAVFHLGNDTSFVVLELFLNDLSSRPEKKKRQSTFFFVK